MRRTKVEALETKARILESALDIFSVKNFASTSLLEIAQNAGLSKGALYWHFKNKNDLLIQLVESTCREDGEAFLGLFEERDCGDALRGYYKRALARLFEDARYKKIHGMMLRRRYEWPEEVQTQVRQLVSDSMERDRQMAERLIARGQREGKIRKDVSAGKVALLISSIFHGLYAIQLCGKLPGEFPEYTDILFDAFDRELSACGGRRAL